MSIKTFNKSVRENNLIPDEFFPRGRKQNNKNTEYTPPANINACVAIVAVQNAIKLQKLYFNIYTKKVVYVYACTLAIKIYNTVWSLSLYCN